MGTVFNKVSYLPIFERELKRLERRFRSLRGDIDMAVDTSLNLFHKIDPNYDGIERIPGLGFEDPPIYKVTKFACRALKGRGVKSGIRLIYAYRRETDSVKFIEIYFKGDKEKEDRSRIIELYKASGGRNDL